jgi:hypothetical protein
MLDNCGSNIVLSLILNGVFVYQEFVHSDFLLTQKRTCIFSDTDIGSNPVHATKIKKMLDCIEIDWNEIEQTWEDHIDETNNEEDYDTQFDFLRECLEDFDIDWETVEEKYFDYIDRTCNEDDHDVKFRNFKKFVTN